MSRLLTWVLRLLPLPGVALILIGAGFIGALPDSWWDPKGFIVNIVSGATAACFGIPLAFFVLQKLLADREVIARRQSTLDMAISGLSEVGRRLNAANGFGPLHNEKRFKVADFQAIVDDFENHRRRATDMLNRLNYRGVNESIEIIAALETELPLIVNRVFDSRDYILDTVPEQIHRSRTAELTRFLSSEANIRLLTEGFHTIRAGVLDQILEATTKSGFGAKLKYVYMYTPHRYMLVDKYQQISRALAAGISVQNYPTQLVNGLADLSSHLSECLTLAQQNETLIEQIQKEEARFRELKRSALAKYADAR